MSIEQRSPHLGASDVIRQIRSLSVAELASLPPEDLRELDEKLKNILGRADKASAAARQVVEESAQPVVDKPGENGDKEAAG